MTASLLDRIALWWLDRRTAPPSSLIRFIGGPLDGETHDVGHGVPLCASVHVYDEWHYYRSDGTCDDDGARRLCYDPQEEK